MICLGTQPIYLTSSPPYTQGTVAGIVIFLSKVHCLPYPSSEQSLASDGIQTPIVPDSGCLCRVWYNLLNLVRSTLAVALLLEALLG